VTGIADRTKINPQRHKEFRNAGMFDFAVGALLLTFLGFMCLIIAGAPMIRAAERQHGLKAAHDEVKRLRGERATERSAASEVAGKRDDAASKLAVMTAELRKLEEEIARLPKQIFELTFELGAPDPGMQSFEFVVSRNPTSADSSGLPGPERALWKAPRIVRAWSRNQAAAIAAVEKRFRQADGFTVRAAERLGAAGG
jgi:hypothetical protein